MRRRVVRIAFAFAFAVATIPHGGAALGLAQDRPAIVSDIERRFEGFFIFTTDGSGEFTVYQRVNDGSGLPADPEVVCMLRECFLQLSHVSKQALEHIGQGRTNMETVRQRFRAVRDAYGAMRSAGRGQTETAEIWREAIARLGPCLEHPDAC